MRLFRAGPGRESAAMRFPDTGARRSDGSRRDDEGGDRGDVQQRTAAARQRGDMLKLKDHDASSPMRRFYEAVERIGGAPRRALVVQERRRAGRYQLRARHTRKIRPHGRASRETRVHHDAIAVHGDAVDHARRLLPRQSRMASETFAGRARAGRRRAERRRPGVRRARPAGRADSRCSTRTSRATTERTGSLAPRHAGRGERGSSGACVARTCR